MAGRVGGRWRNGREGGRRGRRSQVTERQLVEGWSGRYVVARGGDGVEVGGSGACLQRRYDQMRSSWKELELQEREVRGRCRWWLQLRGVGAQEKKELDLVERLALWSVADVLVVTSVREGLNLMPLEFMVAREHRPGENAPPPFHCPPSSPSSGARLASSMAYSRVSDSLCHDSTCHLTVLTLHDLSSPLSPKSQTFSTSFQCWLPCPQLPSTT